jgi:hypothetical protein
MVRLGLPVVLISRSNEVRRRLQTAGARQRICSRARRRSTKPKGWLVLHESGTYVRFAEADAALFAWGLRPFDGEQTAGGGVRFSAPDYSPKCISPKPGEPAFAKKAGRP